MMYARVQGFIQLYAMKGGRKEPTVKPTG